MVQTLPAVVWFLASERDLAPAYRAGWSNYMSPSTGRWGGTAAQWLRHRHRRRSPTRCVTVVWSAGISPQKPGEVVQRFPLCGVW